jgi:hypothetical protein
MATTTNYSWSTPDDTALVKDGAAAIRSLGTAIDSTVFTNAGAAIAKTIVDAKGDIIAATAADTVSRLAVGANDTVLTADSSTATGLKWAAPASGGMTLISTTTLTGATVTLSSIPQTYNNLVLVIRNFLPDTDNSYMQVRFNGDSGVNYYSTNLGGADLTAQAKFDDWTSVNMTNDNSVANGISVVTFFDYANTTTYKMGTLLAASTNSSTTTQMNFRQKLILWYDASAISSMVFYTGGNFTSGTVLLYGVK